MFKNCHCSNIGNTGYRHSTNQQYHKSYQRHLGLLCFQRCFASSMDNIESWIPVSEIFRCQRFFSMVSQYWNNVGSRTCWPKESRGIIPTVIQQCRYQIFALVYQNLYHSWRAHVAPRRDVFVHAHVFLLFGKCYFELC